MWVPSRQTTIEEWWNNFLQGVRKEDRKKASGVLLYTVWNVRKERSQRVFHGVSASPARVLALIKDDIQRRDLHHEKRAQ
jgi:hypothetical protein